MTDGPTEAGGDWQTLSSLEAATLEAIAARIVPGDDLGPSAAEAGSVVYVDRALAGPYQTLRTEYQQGLAALDTAARDSYGCAFTRLGGAEQDTLLSAWETGTDAERAFFTMVRRHVLEGFFADPMYGGNQDFAGWRLVGFPGAVGAYTAAEMQSGTVLAKGYSGLQDWIARQTGKGIAPA